MDLDGAQVVHDVELEMLRDDPVAQRVRFVFFPSSGHEVLVIDNCMMLQVRNGELVRHGKRNGYLGPDRLAKEILTDVPDEERTSELLLERAQKIWRTVQKYK